MPAEKDVEPKDIDFVVVRENTEGVYMDAGGVFKQGTPDEVAVQEDINTRKGVERSHPLRLRILRAPPEAGWHHARAS